MSRGCSLLCGVGRRCITPQVPVSLAGYFNMRIWDGVLDDIYVHSLAFQADNRSFGVVQFDLMCATEEVVEGIRERLPLRLDSEDIIFTGTHTHTAPDIRLESRGCNREYNSFVVSKAVEAIVESFESLRPVELFYGETFESRFAFNRRYWMRSGVVVTNPKRGDPDILKPEGPIDPHIPILSIKEGEQTIAVLANIVNHSDTVGGKKVSSDWEGFFRRELSAHLGEETLVVPLIGCSGNINHFDQNSFRDQTSYSEACRIGRGYAETVLKALERLERLEVSPLRVCRSILTVPRREISRDEIEKAKGISQRYEFRDDGGDVTSEDLAVGAGSALKFFADGLLRVLENPAERSFELIACRVGELYIVSLPGEPFVQIGLELKNYLHNQKLMVVSLSNAYVPYIPTGESFEHGGYETQHCVSPNSVRTAELLVDEVKSLLDKLRAETGSE